MVVARAEVRDQARKLRAEGRSVKEIARLVDAAPSSVSVWVRDVLLSDEQRGVLQQRRASASAARAGSNRARRVAKTERLVREAAAQVGDLTDREVFLTGVVAYWAEGTKAKPWRPSTKVRFVNSDADMIRLFVRWTALLGIPKDDLTFSVSIHETADLEAATAFWAAVVDAPAHQFRAPAIKRHRPTTNRHNVGDGYHGCLAVTVRRSVDLNRRIAGWWAGIAAATDRYAAPDGRAW